MTPNDEAAQAATVTARAAAGMCDAADMRRTMDEARGEIAADAEAMEDVFSGVDWGSIKRDLDAERAAKFEREMSPEYNTRNRPHGMHHDDFSAANDAALTGIADQYDEWWHWMQGDLSL